MLHFYTYFRSDTSDRVRIALNLKGLSYEPVPVHLVIKGEQRQARLPGPEPRKVYCRSWRTARCGSASCSPSSSTWRGTHPEPPLLPKDPADEARVRSAGPGLRLRHAPACSTPKF